MFNFKKGTMGIKLIKSGRVKLIYNYQNVRRAFPPLTINVGNNNAKHNSDIGKISEPV